jgi:CRP-like cAMP-binding protein
MIDHLIRKLEQRDALSDEEKRVLDEAVSHTRNVGPDEDLVRDGDRPSESILVLEGFTCRYKLLPDGKRQIMAIHIPGDFVDLHSFIQKKMDHGVATLPPCKVAYFPHEALRRITESHPHLARMLWLSTLIDAGIYREWLVSMGRRSTPGHMAHLLCEMFLRLRVVGLTDGASFQLPVTQEELGDALGLSLVHTNRTLQQLRREGLIAWEGRTVTISDWKHLQQIADFDPTYLHLEQQPR